MHLSTVALYCMILSPIPVSVLICGSKICFAITSLLATSTVADVIEVDMISLISLKAGERETLLLLSVLQCTTLVRLRKAAVKFRLRRADTMTTRRFLAHIIAMTDLNRKRALL